MNLKKLPMSSVSGALVLVLYVGLAKISYLLYPSFFGPRGNWLSDLGSNQLNPHGAIYYRLAGILGGLVLMFFFIGLKDWYKGQKDKSRIFMTIAQLFGVLTSLAFAMTGFFSEDNLVPHSFWSVTNYICFGTAAFFVGFALLYHKDVPRLFSVFCFILAIVDIVSGVYGKTYWLEWLVVFMLLVFVASVSYITNRHLKQGR
ncbi:hypothetical protein [Candidatus Cryosericum terrychapinii]|jgi:membrane-associated HD superfamily phosphohydrolase|uniref:DUF998 domain-containing protein n=1 Tax=Candidatus Cryosericum terrychapinii TaxID=2290919 RepID=A0A398CWS0_9BACT|nr:hypothetical protein [Candidatus Cryosericum terrychapinii]RIE05699.1 hypothetical protein SMC7_05975 [Candidatus Cryosericum terrychapinii]